MGGSDWTDGVVAFMNSLRDEKCSGYRSVPGGPVTGYGTCYSLLSQDYLGHALNDQAETIAFLKSLQCSETGYFEAPELPEPSVEAKHDRQHLLLHFACTCLPVLEQFGTLPVHPLRSMHCFTDLTYLEDWLSQRNLADAWFEGNNLLFVGQILHFLEKNEHHPRAKTALERWFHWHDERIDPATGLWGSDRGSSVAAAIYGGYHQMILYFALRGHVRYHQKLVDATLSIQHADGGFSLTRGGGACEDADAVDILVNCYKRYDYRRPDIRVSLRRCARLLLEIQNRDGGFPYKRSRSYIHMGMEATRTTIGGSSAFSTWFRLHTLALIGQVITNEKALNSRRIGFSVSPSMGWHDSLKYQALVIGPDEILAEKHSIRRNRLTQIERHLHCGLEILKMNAGPFIRAVKNGLAPRIRK